MDCVGWVGHMFYRADVIDNVIGQLSRLNYLGGIQMKIEQGRSLAKTVCMDVFNLYILRPSGEQGDRPELAMVARLVFAYISRR